MNDSIKNVIFPYTDAIYKAVVTDSGVKLIIKEKNNIKGIFIVEYFTQDDVISELARLENNYDIPVGTLTKCIKKGNRIYFNNKTNKIEVIDYDKEENTLLSERYFITKSEVIKFLEENLLIPSVYKNTSRLPNTLKTQIEEYLKTAKKDMHYLILDWQSN